VLTDVFMRNRIVWGAGRKTEFQVGSCEYCATEDSKLEYRGELALGLRLVREVILKNRILQ